MRFEPYVALRYLRSRRKEVFISIITVISIMGVALSVLVLNMALSIMTGFENSLQTKLINANEHVIIRAYSGSIPEWQDLVSAVERVDGVEAAFPYTYHQAMLSLPGVARGLVIRGIANSPRSREKLQSVMENSESVDVLFSPGKVEILRPDGEKDVVELPPLVIGKELRRSLRLEPGDPITLLSPQMSASPQGLVPKLKRFVVVGSYSSGLIEYESALAYTSVESAQHFFGLGDAVTGVEVQVRDVSQASEIASRISAGLGGAGSSFYVTDWTESNRPLWEALKLEKKVYFYVLLLLTLIASFSVVSTLVMVVMEKTKDIAVFKAIGASDRSVMSIFFIEGVVIGALGTLLGTLFGYIGCVLLRYYGFEIDEKVFGLKTVPVQIVLSNFVVVGIAAFFISSLAGIYPAIRAARLRPADALRFE